MPNNITRESLNYHQGIFDNLKNINPNALAANNEQYSQLKEIVNYIRNGASSVEGIGESKFIFLVGPTGAGKSTLLNYLHFGDGGFVVANNDGKGEIKLKNPQGSIANIGSGEGSTTVIPNMYKINGIDGIFLDCAGDGDTSGIIGDIINAMVRNKISQNAQQSKIALISKQGSLDSSGGYGELFKSSLDQNAQFFKDVEFFKDSLGFVITGAARRLDVIESIKKDLHNIAHHNNFTKYKNLINHIIEKSEGNSLIVPFAKASEEANENQPYSARIPSQHVDIKDMIQNLPYSQLPYAGYFDIPRSPESSDAMSRILEAVVERGAYMIRKAIDEAPHPFSICSVEVNPFYEYISGLANGYQADYVKYCKILKYNNYLKINNLDSQAVKTIDADIKFVSNFVGDNNDIVNKDWSLSANIRNIFDSIRENIVEFKTENVNGNLFNSTVNKENIRISFSGNKSGEIKNAIDKVKGNYRDIDTLERLGRDQDSEYYKDVTKKEYDYTETRYRDVKRYEIDYTSSEEDVPMTRKKTVTKYNPVTLKGEVPKKNAVKDQKINFIKEEKNEFGVTVKKNVAISRKDIGQNIESEIEKKLNQKKWGTESKGYTDSADYQTTIAKNSYRSIDVEVITEEIDEPYTVKRKYKKQKVKTHYDKEPYDYIVHKDVKGRELNQEKYSNELTRLQHELANNSQEATTIMDTIPANHGNGLVREDIRHDVRPQVRQLLMRWQDAEFSQYFSNNPENSLEVLNIEAIGDIVEAVDLI